MDSTVRITLPSAFLRLGDNWRSPRPTFQSETCSSRFNTTIIWRIYKFYELFKAESGDINNKGRQWRITQKYLHSWTFIIVKTNQMCGYLDWCVIWWIISLSNEWQELNRVSLERKVEMLTLHSLLKEYTYLFISKKLHFIRNISMNIYISV